jgi:hypothetical protein
MVKGEAIMFCSNCGVKLTEQSKFCSHCGAAGPAVPVKEVEEAFQESAVAAELLQDTQSADLQPVHTVKKNPSLSAGSMLCPLHWIMPLVCLILASSLITGLYFYQKSVNRSMESLLQEGEKLALGGNWKESLVLIESALKKRPEHPVLLKDRALLKDIFAMEARVISTEKQVEENQFNEAIKTIDTLQEELKTRSGPVFERLILTTDKQEEHIVIAQVAHEFPSKDKITDLIPLLNTIKDYDSDEAKKTAGDIKAVVIDLTHEKASLELKDKNFTVAMATVEEGLKLDNGSSKLTELKKTIETKQKEFEDAERARIQKAREAASNEDLINKTAAVELISSNGFYDERTGYFNVEIYIKNVATRPISSIIVYYDLLDESGQVVGNGTGYVLPDVLDVGEYGSVNNYHYTDGSLNSVYVTRFEWYIN